MHPKTTRRTQRRVGGAGAFFGLGQAGAQICGGARGEDVSAHPSDEQADDERDEWDERSIHVSALHGTYQER